MPATSSLPTAEIPTGTSFFIALSHAGSGNALWSSSHRGGSSCQQIVSILAPLHVGSAVEQADLQDLVSLPTWVKPLPGEDVTRCS